jgi:hypothetical protein
MNMKNRGSEAIDSGTEEAGCEFPSGVRRALAVLDPTWHLRCTRVAPERGSVSALLPSRVSILPDGTAIAQYPEGGGSLYFNDLAHLLAHHGLSIRDFEEEELG